MTTLTPNARTQIRQHLPIAAFIRATWPDGTWRGDKCGCTDDRCIGFHHDDREDCDCLPILLATIDRGETS